MARSMMLLVSKLLAMNGKEEVVTSGPSSCYCELSFHAGEKLDPAPGFPLQDGRTDEEVWAGEDDLPDPGSAWAPGAGGARALVWARVRQTAGAARAGNGPGPGQRSGRQHQPGPRRQAHPLRRPAGEPARRLAAVSRAQPRWHQPGNHQPRARLAAGGAARAVGD